MAQKKRPPKRGPPRPSVIEDSDRWQMVILAGIQECLDDELPGHVCITTPSGRACRVTIWFSPGGKA